MTCAPPPVVRPVTFANHTGLHHHRLAGRPVLSAVEALQIMAHEVQAADPRVSLLRSEDAHFLRFFDLPPEAVSDVEALVSIRALEEASCEASLETVVVRGKAKIRRTLEHIRVRFGGAASPPDLPWDVACSPEGPAFRVDVDAIYRDLVPFGPDYQNISGHLTLSQDGAAGWVEAPTSRGLVGPLGSPFPIDAALHVACVWGQRYVGRVLFPVGYSERHIHVPSAPGTHYFCRVLPVARQADRWLFDIRLYDEEGAPTESVIGAEMADVERGRDTVPPHWIRRGAENDTLSDWLRMDGRVQITMIPIDVLPPFSVRTLTRRERERWESLGERRRCSFTAARVALKRLARLADPAAANLPADHIETLDEDPSRPRLHWSSDDRWLAWSCAAAHDSVYAVAAVSRHGRVGVDIEPVAEKAVRGLRMYTSEGERSRVATSPLGTKAAATRIWTAKEAAAKALDVPLASAWSKVEARYVDDAESELTIGDQSVIARHAMIGDRIVTVLILPASESDSR